MRLNDCDGHVDEHIDACDGIYGKYGISQSNL